MFPWKHGADARAEGQLRPYPVGWYGDQGLGEILIEKILSGRKRATMGPAYDPTDRQIGERLRLVDKTGAERAVIRVTGVEILSWRDLTDKHTTLLDLTPEEIEAYLPKYIAREVRPDELVRITYFELVRE